jgi:hypothetical protein
MTQQPMFTVELLEQFTQIHDHAERIEQTLDEFYFALTEGRPYTRDMVAATLAATAAMRRMCDQIDVKVGEVTQFLDGNPLNGGESHVQQ